MRMLRRLGYLEAGLDASAATGYDPLRDDAPELARTLAASVRQCIAFGERAGERVRRLGSDFGAEGEAPTLTGTRCASVQGFSLHANTQVLAHRRDQLERLLRYAARGALSLVSAGGAAHHRHHHARRDDPENPPASEIFCRPTSHCTALAVSCTLARVCTRLSRACPQQQGHAATVRWPVGGRHGGRAAERWRAWGWYPVVPGGQ